MVNLRLSVNHYLLLESPTLNKNNAMCNLFLEPLSKPLPETERGFDSSSPSLLGKGLGVRFERKSHTSLNNQAKKLINGDKRLINEAKRFVHEAKRFINEAKRFVHEAKRFIHEAKRFVHEAKRFVHEAKRFIHEAKRLNDKKYSVNIVNF
jgi:polyhydroxyalkanoate synthesis regulator phasin